MDGAVVDGLDRTLWVSGGLTVVVDLGADDGGDGAVGEGVVAQVAGEADEDPIAGEADLGLRLGEGGLALV